MTKYRYIQSSGKTEKYLTPDEVLEAIRKYFQGEAYVYAVLDYAVALGKYQQGTLKIGVEDQPQEILVPWEYVQELRVFDHTKELRAESSDRVFRCRLREDESAEADMEELLAVDQVQKLWGHVEKGREIAGWSMLRSDRGTALQVPYPLGEEISEGTEIGLCTRQYLSFPEASSGRGLLKVEDERMVGFCLWGGGGENE